MTAAPPLANARGRRLGAAVLVIVLLAAVLVSLVAGAAGLSIGDVVRVLGGGGEDVARTIVLELRLPRAVLAVIVGGGLALGGAVFQALVRNPLAEPYILGVSGGAAVGAVGVAALGVAALTPWAVPVGAFLGALLAILGVFGIARRVGGALDTRVLLLAGVVAGVFFNALIMLMMTRTDIESFRSAVFWMMGSLAGGGWGTVGLLAAFALPACAVLIALARPFDLLALGEETAAVLGAPVERLKLASYVIASLLVAASVAACGVIGFVGLVVPHALRLVWGSGHRFLLPACFLAGAAFLLLADTAARTISAPAELPVGVVTALVGVPLFVTLLARGTR